MTNDFVCKHCSHRLQWVEATFALEMAASYSHSGQSYQQRSLRVTGCTLTENMDNADTICPKCGKTGRVDDLYNLIPVCSDCGNDADSKSGYCRFNSGVFCSDCYQGFKSSCARCVAAKECKLLYNHTNIKDRIKMKKESSSAPSSASSSASAQEQAQASAARSLAEQLGMARTPTDYNLPSTSRSSSPSDEPTSGRSISFGTGDAPIRYTATPIPVPAPEPPEWDDDDEIEDEDDEDDWED